MKTSTTKYFVLASKKSFNDKPLEGRFYGENWVDGETTEPLTYRQANRIARLRGCKLVPWDESKEFARRGMAAIKEGVKPVVAAKAAKAAAEEAKAKEPVQSVFAKLTGKVKKSTT